MRKDRLIYLIIIFILLVILLGTIVGRLRVEMNIQTFSIIALVFITIYYAVQTHNLTKETTKQRRLDFLERVISDMYSPLVHKMIEVEDAVKELPFSQGKIDTEAEAGYGLQDKIDEASRLFSRKDYSFPNEYRNKFNDWLMYLGQLRKEKTKTSKVEFLEYSKQLTSEINQLKQFISNILREEYISSFLRRIWDKQVKKEEKKPKRGKTKEVQK